MEGLLQAHDSIASLTDRAYCSPNSINVVPPPKIPVHHTNSNSLKAETKGYSSSNEDIKKVGDCSKLNFRTNLTAYFFFVETRADSIWRPSRRQPGSY